MGPIKRSIISVTAAWCLFPFAALAQTQGSAHGEQTSPLGTMPTRGMNMEQVQKFFGKPIRIVKPVGDPPIGRWVYDGFIVYFERERVIHALIPSSNQ